MKSVLNLLLLIVASASLCEQCKVDTIRGAIVKLNKNGKLLLRCDLVNGGKLQSLAIDWRHYSCDEIKMKGNFTSQKKVLENRLFQKDFCNIHACSIYIIFFYQIFY